eukprot:CAMPEP_0114348474 /NCGR_PEP_ID=MMETSP0101-20121206/14732_1 /TAXON_ID=38822 ORGANISM="Pteridomonas danica, Strain PT" /NCGR_SAMPLE_ID=MMETSP0101 /ASSEMBLY_ACC=CAM_ASM_000211 /LENGTH=607 /DNA_ID=CAMNT_0001486411 /DNA_START=360 /DNA_END=2181 /DNA_ORIENTATION=-
MITIKKTNQKIINKKKNNNKNNGDNKEKDEKENDDDEVEDVFSTQSKDQSIKNHGDIMISKNKNNDNNKMNSQILNDRSAITKKEETDVMTDKIHMNSNHDHANNSSKIQDTNDVRIDKNFHHSNSDFGRLSSISDSSNPSIPSAISESETSKNSPLPSLPTQKKSPPPPTTTTTTTTATTATATATKKKMAKSARSVSRPPPPPRSVVPNSSRSANLKTTSSNINENIHNETASVRSTRNRLKSGDSVASNASSRNRNNKKVPPPSGLHVTKRTERVHSKGIDHPKPPVIRPSKDSGKTKTPKSFSASTTTPSSSSSSLSLSSSSSYFAFRQLLHLSHSYKNLKRIREKIDNSGNEGKKKNELLKNDLADPRLVYAWWERNFDEAFTRQSRQATEMEANWACIVTGKPELATFKAEFDVTRTIKSEEVEDCFKRLWSHTQASVERRNNRQRQLQQQDSLEEGISIPIEKKFVSSPRRLSSLARPKQAIPWGPPHEMTFAPHMTGGVAARLRKKMTSSLPPIDKTLMRTLKNRSRTQSSMQSRRHRNPSEQSTTLGSSEMFDDDDDDDDDDDNGDEEEEEEDEEEEEEEEEEAQEEEEEEAGEQEEE